MRDAVGYTIKRWIVPGLWRTDVRLLGNARWAGADYQCTVPLILVLAQGGLSTNPSVSVLLTVNKVVSAL